MISMVFAGRLAMRLDARHVIGGGYRLPPVESLGNVHLDAGYRAMGGLGASWSVRAGSEWA